MKKLSCLLVLACFLVTLSGTAFAWSDRSEGRPDQTPGQMFRGPNLAVWHDRNDEFHVKATNFRGQHTFAGVIQTDGRFYDIDERDLENGDYITVDHDRNTIRFRFTGRGMDELSFRVRHGDTVRFDVSRDGHDMPSREIFIGKDAWHPRDNRFTLH